MEEKSQNQTVVRRFFQDADFRQRVLKDPAKTLRQEGYDATPDLVARFKNADHDAIEKAIAAHQNAPDSDAC